MVCQKFHFHQAFHFHGIFFGRESKEVEEKGGGLEGEILAGSDPAA